MVRVSRPPYVHDDQITALRPVHANKAGSLVVLLVQAGVLGTLPPPIDAMEGFELKPPFTLVPVSADLPAVPGAVYERAPEQRRAARWRGRPLVPPPPPPK